MNKHSSKQAKYKTAEIDFDDESSDGSSLILNLSQSTDQSSSSIDLDIKYSDVSMNSERSSIKSKIEYFEKKASKSQPIEEISTLKMALNNRDKFTKKYFNPNKANPNMRINDFSLLCTLGAGSFGRVLLAHHKQTNIFYALKVLKKYVLVKYDQVIHTIYERNILNACDHPNIIRVYSTFKDNSYLYFLTELCPHADLYTLMKRNKYFPENHTKFYAANIFLALEYLHVNGIIYRDLKPENVLIGSNGYLKLIDFGFAKKIDDETTQTLCGTPDYLSPEVLSSLPYGRSVDWWTFGVIIFELNAGVAPFLQKDQNPMYVNIRKGTFAMPDRFSPELSDICRKLIERNVNRRLGCLKRGSNDVKEHRWFNSIEWFKIFKQTVNAPYIPKAKDPLDLISKRSKLKEEPLKITKTDQYTKEFNDF